MATFSRFEDLDDEAFFVAYITNHFQENDWSSVLVPVGVKPVVDPDRVRFAFGAYHSNLSEIRIKVKSQNPDHYKRAACLLDALNRAQVMQDFEYDGTPASELEAGTAHGLSYDDCQYRLKFVRFFEENGNQLMSFDAAYRCCQTYEEANKPYSPNYLENMVHYLCENDAQNVGSLYMIFKTYWA